MILATEVLNHIHWDWVINMRLVGNISCGSSMQIYPLQFDLY
jgi:Ca2+/H+ antiporter